MKKIIIGLIVGLIGLIGPISAQTEIIDGDLIRAQSDIDVYIVKIVDPSSSSGQEAKKFKRLILNPEIFNKYGHLKWENIKEVSQEKINQYLISDLVRAVDDQKVYKLYPNGDVGEKRWIKTADDFLDLGYDWDAIYTINNFERDYYLPGEDLVALKPPSEEAGPGEQEPTVPVRNPTTINVPSDYSTIQKAIDVAINGDTISIGSGTYNENLVISKNIKLIGDFAESVIINGQDNGSAIDINGANDFLLQRFTIKNQNNKGIYCSGEGLSKGKIKNVIFTGSSWAIYADGNCDLDILNNIFYGNRNSADNEGAGILIKNSFSYGITPEIINNTIDDNYHGIWSENANLIVMNNIITNSFGGSTSAGIYHNGNGASDNRYNDVWQNGFNYNGDAKPGNGSLVSDPRYFRPAYREYTLSTAVSTLSPCIDKGNPSPVYNDKVLLSGNVNYTNDIGAYGGPDNAGWNP